MRQYFKKLQGSKDKKCDKTKMRAIFNTLKLGRMH